MLRRTLRTVVASVVIIGVGLHLHRSWPQSDLSRVKLIPVILSGFLATIGILIQPVLWQRTLGGLGFTMPLPAAMRIWYLSQLTRYIPGLAWPYLARPHLAAQSGIPPAITALSMAIETIQTLASGLLLAALTLLSLGPLHGGLIAAALLAPLSLCYVQPTLLRLIVARLLARAGGSPTLPHGLSLVMLAQLPGYCVVWMIQGLGLLFLAQSIRSLGFESMPVLTGMNALAWGIGFLSLLTPSGLGVREWALSNLLTPLTSVPDAVLLSVIWRFLLTVVEVGSAALIVGVTPSVTKAPTP